jgi:hypothetical protein
MPRAQAEGCWPRVDSRLATFFTNAKDAQMIRMGLKTIPLLQLGSHRLEHIVAKLLDAPAHLTNQVVVGTVIF